jgi:hypothetical protein
VILDPSTYLIRARVCPLKSRCDSYSASRLQFFLLRDMIMEVLHDLLDDLFLANHLMLSY